MTLFELYSNQGQILVHDSNYQQLYHTFVDITHFYHTFVDSDVTPFSRIALSHFC